MIIQVSSQERKNWTNPEAEITMYRLNPLWQNPAKQPDAALEVVGEFVIEGDLEQYTVVSLPPHITREMGEAISQKLNKLLGREILAVTHNIGFLALEKLSKEDTAQICQQLQSHVDKEAANDMPPEPPASAA